MLNNTIGIGEVNWEILLWEDLWYKVQVSDWVLAVLNLDNEQSQVQKQKIWDWISNKESITLYRQGWEIHSQYWEQVHHQTSKVLKLTRKQVHFIVNWDIGEVMQEIDRLFNEM